MTFTELAKPAGMGREPTTPHELLYDAYIHRRLHLGMKPPVNSRESPVHNFWENVFPYALIVFMIGYYTWTMGVKGLILSASIGVPVGAFVIPRWIMTKVRRRAVGYVFASAENWDAVWRVGGISMRLAEEIDVICESPEGDWRAFATQHFSKKSEG
ncbi:MAG: hypothetical protein ACM30I_11790 [Gemmatimonas sp.]